MVEERTASCGIVTDHVPDSRASGDTGNVDGRLSAERLQNGVYRMNPPKKKNLQFVHVARRSLRVLEAREIYFLFGAFLYILTCLQES